MISTSKPIKDVAVAYGVGPETLRNWLIKYREANGGTEADLTVSERARLKELEREVQELKAEAQFLKKAPTEFILSRILAQSIELDLTRASQVIHDGVSQLMSNAVQILQAVGSEESMGALDRDRINRVLMLLREGIAVARSISRELMPASLERVGLAKTLKFELENLSLVGVASSFSFRAPEPIPQDFEIALYRIASEALLNVKKHAQAMSVTLRVESKGPRLTMTIFDDGVGFDGLPVEDRTQSHLGLLSMHARARLVGGTFVLKTSLGQGTLITVELPNERRLPAKGLT